jgi:SOS-response transcriptional repressor LexA
VIARGATVRIPVVCMVGAARSFEDSPIQGWREIRPIKNARPFDRFCAAPVAGNSLIDEGIIDGDYVIVRLNFEDYDITPGKLAVVNTPYGLLLKHVYQTLDRKVRLVSANPAYEDIVLDADDVTVQGVVVRIERDL